jgi:hypothetical protein
MHLPLTCKLLIPTTAKHRSAEAMHEYAPRHRTNVPSSLGRASARFRRFELKWAAS